MITTDDVKIEHYQYDDLPLTLFPSAVDVSEGSIDESGEYIPATNLHPYMKDINSTETKSLVTQFNDKYKSNNQNECEDMLENDLNSYTFNAEKYNQLSDAIIALERFALVDMKVDRETTMDYLNEAVNDKLGQNFNLDYNMSLEFINEQTQILKED